MQPPGNFVVRLARAALPAALALTLAWIGTAGALRTLGGADLRWIDADGHEVARQWVSAIDVALVAEGGRSHADAVELRFTAAWDAWGASRLRLRSDGHAELRLDGQLLARLEGEGPANTDVRVAHGGLLDVRFVPSPGDRRLRLFAAPADPHEPFEPLDWRRLTPQPATLHALLSRAERPLRAGTRGVWVLWALALAFLVLRARWHGAQGDNVRRAWPAPLGALSTRLGRQARLVWLTLGLLLTLYAAALRFEALVGRYWSADAPGWAQTAASDIRSLRPGENEWRPAEHPYLGDPFSYLLYAREPRGFYAAHVREPLFVNATRFWLWLAGGRDLAVNLASASFSVLVVPALLLLGSVLGARWAGLLAAFCWAIEWQVVELSVEGWRDDAFALFVTLAAWALLRLRARPTPRQALVAGVVAAAACLTRITSLSFLLPVMLLVACERDGAARQRRRSLLLAAGVATLLTAPFLVNCWRVYGDPLYAINAHTAFYRARSGADSQRPESWLDYLAGSRPPLATLEMSIVGVSAYPFESKWRGFDDWSPWLGPLLCWLALAGLLRWTAYPDGRVLLLLGVTATLPFAFTWDIPGGSEWRFTLHAYPLLLLAAATALTAALRALDPARLHASPAQLRLALRPRLRPAAAWLALLLATAVGLCVLRRGVLSETLRRAGVVRIETGWRHALVFGTGWSWPVDYDAREARLARAGRAALRVPLAAGRANDLQLRIRALDASTHRVRALMDGRELGTFEVAPGSRWPVVALHAPADACSRPWGELVLVTADGQPLNLALWYAAVSAAQAPPAASGTWGRPVPPLRQVHFR